MLALLVGCGSPLPREHRAPLRFEAGVATLDAPLSDRIIPVEVATERYVVIFGGLERRSVQPRGDGVVYDLERQVWVPMPAAPFSGPLAYAAGVWTGSEVVVVGTPCPDPKHEEDGEDIQCGRDPVAAAYSPDRNSWRVLPELDLANPTGGYAPLFRGVGFATGRAVFTFSGRDAVYELALVDPVSGATTPAVAPTDPCVLGDRLLAVGPDSNGNFVSPVEPSPEVMRVRAWTAERGWVDEVSAPPMPGRVFSDRVSCGPGAAAYLPVHEPPVGLTRDLRWLDAGATTWAPVPDLVPQGYPGVMWIAGLRDVKVLATGAHLFTLDRNAAAWTTHPLVPGHGLLVAGRYLVATDNDEGVRIRIVDVAALPAV